MTAEPGNGFAKHPLMCGIFGILLQHPAEIPPRSLAAAIDTLFLLSESRGKEASGLAISRGGRIDVYKSALAASTLLRQKEYRLWLRQALGASTTPPTDSPLAIIGHSRLVTNGAMEIHENNQPVIAHGFVGIHNGIIVNERALWAECPEFHAQYGVDTEAFLALLRHYLRQTGSASGSLASVFQRMRGSASVAILPEDAEALLLGTNTGSLYVSGDTQTGMYAFASERYILMRFIRESKLGKRLASCAVRQISPGTGEIISLINLESQPIAWGDVLAEQAAHDRAQEKAVTTAAGIQKRIADYHPSENTRVFNRLVNVFSDSQRKELAIDDAPIRRMRRCTRCVLPETMPGIAFDEAGVCNTCRAYVSPSVAGEQTLRDQLAPFRKTNGDPDCLVSFSGGRDSSYGLHYIKTVLGMNPVAYTYDWGMVTDLARRNQARLCGQLGVEHILVSADIRWKRENIRKNVLAWMHRPSLGTVPLFMAGDKQWFYYANMLQRQIGADVQFQCINPLERTDFKTGFCGVLSPAAQSKRHYALSLQNQFRLAAYYGKEYLRNPAYLNQSLLDTLGAFGSYYLIPHKYVNLFNYVRWDERTINDTLLSTYDWEISPDTTSTWRIGDGTASFYNYIYYCIAGFTENDTFRSNQIREGAITREYAEQKIYEENLPRFDSIQWYCDTIGIDAVAALRTIRSVPKLYRAYS
jgi:glutamine---fructose-6-phosphate transaminase (isomerizing)